MDMKKLVRELSPAARQEALATLRSIDQETQQEAGRLRVEAEPNKRAPFVVIEAGELRKGIANMYADQGRRQAEHYAEQRNAEQRYREGGSI